MSGALERVSVAATKVVGSIPVVRLLVVHVAPADLVQQRLTQHRIVAHVVHRRRLQIDQSCYGPTRSAIENNRQSSPSASG